MVPFRRVGWPADDDTGSRDVDVDDMARDRWCGKYVAQLVELESLTSLPAIVEDGFKGTVEGFMLGL